MNKTKAELALEQYLAGLTEKKVQVSDNHITAIHERNANPDYQRAIDRRTQDPTWRKKNHASVLKTVQTDKWKTNRAAGIEQMKNDPVWQKEQQERFKRRSSNEQWLKRKTEASRKLAQDPVWLANNKQIIQERCAKPVMTPQGAFGSLTEAGLIYNEIKQFRNGRPWVSHQIKVNPTEFYYITREEYQKLTLNSPKTE